MHRKSAFHPAYRRSQPPGVRRRRVLVGGARRAGEPVPGEAQFTSLPGAFPGLVTAIQAVDDEPRYHVDIETDDVAAETARLVALGAVEPRRWLADAAGRAHHLSGTSFNGRTSSCYEGHRSSNLLVQPDHQPAYPR